MDGSCASRSEKTKTGTRFSNKLTPRTGPRTHFDVPSLTPGTTKATCDEPITGGIAALRQSPFQGGRRRRFPRHPGPPTMAHTRVRFRGLGDHRIRLDQSATELPAGAGSHLVTDVTRAASSSIFLARLACQTHALTQKECTRNRFDASQKEVLEPAPA